MSSERPGLHEAMTELLVSIKRMGETGRFVVMTYDPETKAHIAHGSIVEGPEAAILAGQLRQNLDRSQLADVNVLVVPWEPWEI